MAFLAAALKGAHSVSAEVVTASVILLAFIDVWAEKMKRERQQNFVSELNL